EVRPQLGSDAGEEQLVVVDDEHANGHRAPTGRVSFTSVPDPGRLEISADPPARSIRPRMDSAIPRRSVETAAGSNPRPRSRTYAVTDPLDASTYTDNLVTPACRAALVMASPHAWISARTRPSIVAFPTATTSTLTWWSC